MKENETVNIEGRDGLSISKSQFNYMITDSEGTGLIMTHTEGIPLAKLILEIESEG